MTNGAAALLGREEDSGLERQTQGTTFRDFSYLAGLGRSLFLEDRKDTTLHEKKWK